MKGSMAVITTGIAVIGTMALVGGLAGAAEPAFKYVGAKSCKSCHSKESIGNQYGAWKEARHSKAFNTLLGEEAIKIAKEKGIAGPPSEAGECLKCHSTAYGLEPKDYSKKPLALADGVQCETCHGPGSAYRKKKNMASHDKALANGLMVPDAKTCLGCHNDENPTWDPAKYTLADGTRTGFDFDQAQKKINHSIPKDVKGKSLEIEKQKKSGRTGAEEDEDETE